MDQAQTPSSTKTSNPGSKEQESFVLSLWGVRYQVKDVARSIDFYTEKLGFHLITRPCPHLRRFQAAV